MDTTIKDLHKAAALIDIFSELANKKTKTIQESANVQMEMKLTREEILNLLMGTKKAIRGMEEKL
ncbi:MAG: hypothetical protein GY861_04470 [bacterium]|nr:hypothetical protein [bacterium]